MKAKNIYLTVLLTVVILVVKSQTPQRTYRNFPLVVGVQFQSLGLPSKKFLSAFSNPGIRIGTEVSLNGRQSQNWAQGFTFGYNLNKNAGNSLSVYTQSIYRPTIAGNFYGEVKFGAGYMWSMHPTDAFKDVNGQWVDQGTAAKTMFIVPAGISVGYTAYHAGTYVAPFISYDLVAAVNYNRIVPVLPMSAVQVGTRIYFIKLSQRK